MIGFGTDQIAKYCVVFTQKLHCVSQESFPGLFRRGHQQEARPNQAWRSRGVASPKVGGEYV